MQPRVWIRSGVVEELDERQLRLLRWVYDRIVFYYDELHGTRPCYRHPLSLSRLMKLTKRSGCVVANALRYLAHTVPVGSTAEPPIYYDRGQSVRNKSHRPYRIFVRREVKPDFGRPDEGTPAS